MEISILTKEDLQQFKMELLNAIEQLIENKKTEQKLWMRSSEVKTLLNISSGTLQNLKVNGTLSCSKIGGTLYYNSNEIQELLKKQKK